MSRKQFISQAFANTSVDVEAVERIARKSSPYVILWAQLSLPASAREPLRILEYFEGSVNRWLVDGSKTLKHVYPWIPRIIDKSDHNLAYSLMKLSLRNIRQTLIMNEWYEIIPRLDRAERNLYRRYPNKEKLIMPTWFNAIRLATEKAEIF